MKYLVKIAAAVGLFSMAMSSCVDEIKFGDDFLEKAPGVDITKDTIFAKGEYARQFLWKAYGQKYFGLPTIWDGGVQVRMNTGMFETLSDCFHDHVDWTNVRRLYYPRMGMRAPVLDLHQQRRQRSRIGNEGRRKRPSESRS